MDSSSSRSSGLAGSERPFKDAAANTSLPTSSQFGQMIPVTPSEAFGPRTPPELLVIPGAPESV